ncbi:MAG: hypothetical protein E6K36_11220 [Gammaproteobacteria bacterium]|nr:MAG: hypothetical protein E6K40_02415 [Gammaproteobacteria bacterium]TLZ01592.1 MAG: hypothetical protein E6K36_11220 [Gammaproteobacteria bacterium]
MRLLAAVALVLLSATAGTRATAQQPLIPRALEEWQGWVLKGKEFHRCPFLAGSNIAAADSYRCVWPERLLLNLDAHGGTFSQRWQVYTENWVALPGDLERWPQAVSVDGAPAAVVARGDVPYVRLTPGSHALSGRFVWEARPETLAIPTQTALLDLLVDGQRVLQPERPGGRLALGRQGTAAEPRRLDVQLYRLVEDDIPLRLVTRLRLRAAGDAREEQLARVLPAGFIPMSLQGALPARLEPDGRLRVQVRAGRFELILTARQAQASATLSSPGEPGLAREEVWSFAANDRLRVAAVEGVAGIDPAQANVPEEWRRYPAFRMAPGSELRIVERSRGLSNTDQNRLHLRRRLWLDFDHDGLTAVDEVSGTLRRDWRLGMRAPYRLASARSGAEALLVTSSASQGETGVELRSPSVQLSVVARSAHPYGALPATGWTNSFEEVSGELYLPPGHRLLAVLGADVSPTAWLDRWGLWNLFGVLVIAVFSYWLAGPLTATLGGLGLFLTYQAAPELIWVWGNLLAAVALARAAPPGRLARVASVYRTVSFAVLALGLVPFTWSEVRHAIYPQLEVSAYSQTRAAPTLARAAPGQLEAPAPAAAPPILTAIGGEVAKDRALSAAGRAGTLSSEPALVSARRATSAAEPNLARYAAGTLLQAGPGLPAWDYGGHPFGWTGPVDPDQSLRFVVLGPLAVALWRIAGVAALAWFFIRLARQSFGTPVRLPGFLKSGGALGAVLLACVAAAPHGARAQSTPDPALLNELRDRLTQAPPCASTCAEIMQAQVHVSADRVQIDLKASALALLAVAVPSAGDRWQIDSVAVDGASTLTVAREPDDDMWVPLKSGVRTIRIEGRLVGDSVHLAFPLVPRTISVDAVGWDVAGVNAGRLVSGALDLTRQPRAGSTATTANPAAGEAFPAFVRVVRNFRLDLDWSVATSVQRVAPEWAAFTVAVPLVAGESVLTEGLDVRGDGVALAGLAAGQAQREWTSSLARSERLALRLTATPARAEVWRFVVSPQWRVDFIGLPAVLPEDLAAAQWVFEYRPRVGEQLELAVTRPPAVPGRTLAIDAVHQRARIGRHSSEHELELRYRSTQGGRYAIQLPKEGSVTQVAVDGEPTQIRPDGGELPLSLLPGKHTVRIAWRSKDGTSMASRPDTVDLRAPSSNVMTTLALPADRWPLMAIGGGVGPAFLYWGELLVFLVVASLLGRWPWSPLRTSEWLVLGLGLSTLSWRVLVTVAAWLFAMRWREQWRGAYDVKRWQFNMLQCALAALTLFAVTSLVLSGVRYGLLASPDMGVTGPGSGGNTFSWFVDRATATLPQPVVYSLPLWVYRTIMFAWALWIALALARWLRFAWRAWSAGGIWRGAVLPPTLPAAGQTAR